MNTEYLSIKEFAKAAAVSQQSVYKRLSKADDELQRFVKEVEKKKYINVGALAVLYSVDYKPKKAVAAADSDSPIFELLKEQLEGQRKDIEEKDRQIAQLMEQVATAHRLIDQQQQLAALDRKRILELEAAAAEKGAAPAEGRAEAAAEKEEAPAEDRAEAAAADQKQAEEDNQVLQTDKPRLFNIFRRSRK